MVLAPRHHRQLFARPTFRGPGQRAWHPILSEMGMIVISSTLAVGPIDQTFDARGDLLGEAGRLTQGAFRRVADDLAWWASASRDERQRQSPPY